MLCKCLRHRKPCSLLCVRTYVSRASSSIGRFLILTRHWCARVSFCSFPALQQAKTRKTNELASLPDLVTAPAAGAGALTFGMSQKGFNPSVRLTYHFTKPPLSFASPVSFAISRSPRCRLVHPVVKLTYHVTEPPLSFGSHDWQVNLSYHGAPTVVWFISSTSSPIISRSPRYRLAHIVGT